MTNIKERMALTKIWCENHNFPYKAVGNTSYWQTMVATAEWNHEHRTVEWHDREYFDNIKGEN